MKEKARFDMPKGELEDLYKFYSTAKIGEMYGVCAEVIRRRIKEYGIKSKPSGSQRSFDPPAKDLESLYQQMSMAEIAKRYGVGETVVFKRLKQHGITLKGHEKHGHRTLHRGFSGEHLANIRKANAQKRGKYTGENSPNWKGGSTDKLLALRRSGAYKEWKKQSLARASNRCESCGLERGAVCECCGTKVALHVHHVQSFAKYPELRFDPNNSEVLCPKCHASRHY